MDAPRIIVYSLEQARAAVAAAAGRPVILMSAHGMAGFMGPLWFKELIDGAAGSGNFAVTAALDCADEAGTALAALRCGFRLVRFTGAEETRQRLDDIAHQTGASVEGAVAAPTLDLLDCQDPASACQAFFPPD